ncbi:ABC transporter with metal-binding/Fe-S-binding domain ATP-binding protein [Methanomicrobium sp. W14]|uniref:diphthine--ammonia ligase n=1 Tax=Methanomicrobium sp. W14 TaxID=2817839 RepID=UPI001AE9B075|nr:diphthine--ammonia ligase [Methanomicrobium sp. W14]MBP2132543.1 ABC transporter with metal-binding/Fe-S-binding domain ATP-binding protein [Methanomicrobium sp. W14]
MKLGVLFSGGKDSAYSCCMAMKKEEVVCLISLLSKNMESYMFHTPNINLASLQSKACEIPLLEYETKGEKEIELKDLDAAVCLAKKKYGIEGIVTGAVMSVYQASRIQKICLENNLWCFNPLWYADQAGYMDSILKSGFEVIISGVFSAPFDESWLGKKIDREALLKLHKFSEKYIITLTGEGGEYETFVCDAPFFKKRIVIDEYEVSYKNYNGTFSIKKAHLENK